MNDISLIRGDTLKLQIELTNELGEPYEVKEDDSLVFTVKKSTLAVDVLMQKKITAGIILITHEDTKDFAYGTYKYDVQLTQSNGDVTTVIPPSNFIIMEEVNFD